VPLWWQWVVQRESQVRHRPRGAFELSRPPLRGFQDVFNAAAKVEERMSRPDGASVASVDDEHRMMDQEGSNLRFSCLPSRSKPGIYLPLIGKKHPITSASASTRRYHVHVSQIPTLTSRLGKFGRMRSCVGRQSQLDLRGSSGDSVSCLCRLCEVVIRWVVRSASMLACQGGDAGRRCTIAETGDAIRSYTQQLQQSCRAGSAHCPKIGTRRSPRGSLVDLSMTLVVQTPDNLLLTGT
jgi:hypothetical protein